MRIPLLERIELYQRSTGETSDVVEKQMYAFPDRDEAETLLALRPEGTPGVVRAYIEAGLDRSDPEQRFYYGGPMFRRERPQKGRFRQFHQFGVEIFGRADAACDAELLVMIDELRRELGLELELQINSLGDAECRPAFRAALLEYGRAHFAELCEDCHQRLERNPLRLLDCKIDVKLAATAPTSLDYLCEDCRRHFATVERLLTASGVAYVVNPRLVRGLDYYMRTTFEVVSMRCRLTERGGRRRALRRTGRSTRRRGDRRYRLRDRNRAAGACGGGQGPLGRMARRRSRWCRSAIAGRWRRWALRGACARGICASNCSRRTAGSRR